MRTIQTIEKFDIRNRHRLNLNSRIAYIATTSHTPIILRVIHLLGIPFSCLVGGAVDALEKRKSIAAIKEESLGMNDKPDFITVKGSVSYIKHDNDCWYTACPTAG